MNEKKMFYIELKMTFYFFDILEQFDLYVFYHVDMLIVCFLFYLFFLFLGFLLIYDLRLGNVFFVLFIIFISIYFNTTNFISCVIFFVGINLYYECMSPVIEVGYFIIALISDGFLRQTQQHLGGKLNTYYFFLVSTAVILGLCNLFGIIPWSKVLTAHFIFAFYFSLGYFITNLIYGLYLHRVRIFNLFLANDIPLFIIPILICIEAISFFSRIFSLAIRLFANLVAGHILLKILVIFLCKILQVHMSLGFPAVIIYLGILIIISLEVIINILQVYIFNMLLIIYINSILNLH